MMMNRCHPEYSSSPNLLVYLNNISAVLIMLQQKYSLESEHKFFTSTHNVPAPPSASEPVSPIRPALDMVYHKNPSMAYQC
jgi:hypothetical protein